MSATMSSLLAPSPGRLLTPHRHDRPRPHSHPDRLVRRRSVPGPESLVTGLSRWTGTTTLRTTSSRTPRERRGLSWAAGLRPPLTLTQLAADRAAKDELTTPCIVRNGPKPPQAKKGEALPKKKKGEEHESDRPHRVGRTGRAPSSDLLGCVSACVAAGLDLASEGGKKRRGGETPKTWTAH
jgi:hypothetical protein